MRGRQSERYLPERVDEDPQKTAARYGTAEQDPEKQTPEGQAPEPDAGPGKRRTAPDRPGGGRSGPGPRETDAKTASSPGANPRGTSIYETRPYGTGPRDAEWLASMGLDPEGFDLAGFDPEGRPRYETGAASAPYGESQWGEPQWDPTKAGGPQWDPSGAGEPLYAETHWGRSYWNPFVPRGTSRGGPHRGGYSPWRRGWEFLSGQTTPWRTTLWQATPRRTPPGQAASGQDGPDGEPQWGPPHFRRRRRTPSGQSGGQPEQTVAQLARRAMASAGGKAAQAGAKLIRRAVPLLAALIGLIALPVLLIVIVFLPLSFQTAPPDINDAFLCITELDARMERDILAAPAIDSWYLNGQPISPSDIRIQTDAEFLLLYLECAYDTAALSAPIQGFFGGGSVQAELDAIHGRLYSWRVEQTVIPPEEEDGEPTIIREVWVTARHIRTLLDQAGAVSQDCRERMDAMTQAGAYSSMEELASPFNCGWYVKDRWGWYAGGGGLARRDGVVLIPLGSSPVYACAPGAVAETGRDCVTVAMSGGRTLTYSQLTALSVSPGQQLEVGDRVGAISSTRGLALSYSAGGGSVNPVFYLPHAGAAEDIVQTAASQIGNAGGEPYWRWFGSHSRIEWCGCFVSWCADQCGYLDAGVLPKFSGCGEGARWFKARGLWQDRGFTPSPGCFIFFDWDAGNDGLVDHVGVVSRVEFGRVYTIEGNSGDRVRECSYPLGDPRILGYGTPAY